MKAIPSRCEAAVAKLIRSTKRKVRPLSLAEINSELRIAIDCYGSLDEVAELISLSPSMLKRFLLVDNLVPKLKTMVSRRQIDSIDAVAEIAGLSSHSQNLLADVLPKHPFDTEDIRGIVRLLRRHAELGIEEITKRVLGSKAKRVFVYEMEINPHTQPAGELRKIFESALGKESVADIQRTIVLLRVKLTPEGKKRLSGMASAKNVTISRLLREMTSLKQ